MTTSLTKENWKAQYRQQRIIARHERAARACGPRAMVLVSWEKNMLMLKRIHAEIEPKRTALIGAR